MLAPSRAEGVTRRLHIFVRAPSVGCHTVPSAVCFDGAVQWRSAGAKIAQRTLLLKHGTGSLLFNGFNLLNALFAQTGPVRSPTLHCGRRLVDLGRSLHTIVESGALRGATAEHFFCGSTLL